MKLVFLLALFVASAAAGTIPHISGRITNGEVARPGQLPYQAGISLGLFGWCGGTLISERWVLTAAHCTTGVDSVIVYLGAINIKNADESGQSRIHVSKSGIFNHEKWDPNTIANDIALIKLPSPIEFNEYIQPAYLPKRSKSYSSYVGDTVIASGWGFESDSATSISSVLNYIDTTIISQSVCENYFKGMITPNMICASGKDGRSVCHSDSGGPLVYKDKGQNVLIGATSFGSGGGCELGYPGVFTRITAYLDWIDAKTKLVN